MAMAQIPFPKVHQLNIQLGFNTTRSPLCLDRSDQTSNTLPGQPRISLCASGLENYVLKEHSTPELDSLAPWLWLVSTPRSSHISPLHHQASRGRKIVIVENPQLHLVWFYDQVFVKPIPRYLLSYAFWQYLATQPDVLQQSVVGFLRTYSHLIRYESDYRIAMREEYGLIPEDDGEERITWERFAAFIGWFDKIEDDIVNPRYHYGELRLTRLNFYTRIFLGKLTFHHIHSQWRTFLGQIFAPLLSLFAVLTVILNAIQVELAAEPMIDGSGHWLAFAKFSHCLSIVVLVLTTGIIVTFGITVIFLFAHDIWFARSVLKEKKRGLGKTNTIIKSGVV